MPNYILENKNSEAQTSRIVIHYPGSPNDLLKYAAEHKLGGEWGDFDVHRLTDLSQPTPLIICVQKRGVKVVDVKSESEELEQQVDSEEIQIDPDDINLEGSDLV